MKLQLSSALLLLTAVSVSSAGTELSGGIVTRTDVDYLADLTKDVRDITDYMAAGSSGIDDALSIYVNGKNAEKSVGNKFTLASLSTTLSSQGTSSATPPFLFHLYGLSGRDSSTISSYLTYADSFVRSSIAAGKESSGVAALVLNMWMYAADILFQGLSTCQKMVEADNPSQFTLGTAGFDEFIALWIGTGSSAGSGNGDSLYALTEQSYALFGGDLDEDPVNTKIKSLYQEASSLLSVADFCTAEYSESPRKLWSISTQVLSQMQVPLIRMLVYSLVQKDTENTVLYANALIPQAAQCRPSAYKRLKEYVLVDSPRFDKITTILRDLQDIYACFGLSCSDVGDIVDTNSVNVPDCVAADDRAAMAEYTPTSDVNVIARIDLDVLQIRYLTAMGYFSQAKLWYMYGRNSPVETLNENDPFEYYSLADLAVASSRKVADPYYTAFITYHNDNNYADTLIRATIAGTGKWSSSMSVAQRSAIITETCAFMVVYMQFLTQMTDAVNQCKGSSSEGEYDLTHPWDEVAALIIGSLEGTEEGGSLDTEDGQLIWGLSTRNAFQFQTENGNGYPKANSNLEDYLYAGKGEIDAAECDAFETTTKQIFQQTLIPLMQGVMRYAAANDGLDSTSESSGLALGEVYALALIPIMTLYDEASATIVAENMIYESGIDPVRDGAQVVADAIGSFAISAGLRCGSLGSTSDVNPCKNNGGSSAWGRSPTMWVMAVTSILTYFLAAV
eukprot:Nitzschia sp. Nitz4//scaffold182_size44100//30858//33151//NITZ4_007258-RA/size44100-augustus-gene-0.26-mRNA-1//-1//CDS//3329539577//3684//frame0